ncbi:MAG TPA: hypothetical protein VH560_08610 [Polyangia bacterium]|nr:hypothetical protein [Polyangia bacterium]
MSSPLLQRLSMGVAVFLLVAGCRGLDLKSGGFPCSAEGHCPSPFVCQNGALCVSPDAAADAAMEHAANVDAPIGDVNGDSARPIDAPKSEVASDALAEKSDGGTADGCVADAACDADPCAGVTCTVAGEVCQHGACVDPCATMTCPGQKCVSGACVDLCVGVQCGASQTCMAGRCTDNCVGPTCACANVTCPATQKCVAGACQSNCTGVTCTSGQRCDAASGSCVLLCMGVTCSATQKCDPSSGSCVPLCTGVTCAATQHCAAATGACVDNCVGVSCPTGQKCVSSTATCVPNCTGVTCGANLKCDPGTGTCVDNCAGVTCGANLKCDSSTGSCVDICTGGGTGTAAHCCTSPDCPQSTLPICSGHTCVAIAVGQTCTSSGQCGTGHCAVASTGTGSICCQTACNGACDSACGRADGVCIHKGARTLCGTIPGPNPGTNDVFEVCDGNGGCVAPKVYCRAAAPSCQLDATHACCSRLAMPGDPGSIQERACGAVSTCVPLFTNSQASGESCRSTSDCPTGQTCCQTGQDASLWNVCATSCGSSPVVCDPNASTCTSPTMCVDSGDSFFVCF